MGLQRLVFEAWHDSDPSILPSSTPPSLPLASPPPTVMDLPQLIGEDVSAKFASLIMQLASGQARKRRGFSLTFTQHIMPQGGYGVMIKSADDSIGHQSAAVKT